MFFFLVAHATLEPHMAKQYNDDKITESSSSVIKRVNLQWVKSKTVSEFHQRIVYTTAEQANRFEKKRDDSCVLIRDASGKLDAKYFWYKYTIWNFSELVFTVFGHYHKNRRTKKEFLLFV